MDQSIKQPSISQSVSQSVIKSTNQPTNQSTNQCIVTKNSIQYWLLSFSCDSETTTSPPVITDNVLSNVTRPPNKNYVRTLGVSALSAPKKTIYIVLFVAAAVVVVLILGAVMFYCRRKLQFSKGAGYGVVTSAKPNEPAVQYRTHAPSIGSSSSYGSTVPLLRQRSLRSRLGSNLTQVSEVDMPLDEKWEIDREHIILSGLLGEGAFGKVMKAEAIGLPNMPSYRFEVAVKMLKGKICSYFHVLPSLVKIPPDPGLMKKDITKFRFTYRWKK